MSSYRELASKLYDMTADLRKQGVRWPSQVYSLHVHPSTWEDIAIGAMKSHDVTAVPSPNGDIQAAGVLQLSTPDEPALWYGYAIVEDFSVEPGKFRLTHTVTA